VATNTSTVTSTPTATPEPTATPLPTPIVSEGWQIYESVDGSFTVAYPSSWGIEQEGVSKKEILVSIIRIPFILIEASGFDVSKAEDRLIAKTFKLLEIVVIIYILIRLGLTKEQLQQVLMKLFPK